MKSEGPSCADGRNPLLRVERVCHESNGFMEEVLKSAVLENIAFA
jgi:hypothetical protein